MKLAGGRAGLARARDAEKDQTYFLYGLRQDQLAHAVFPLGDRTKPEVRDVARRLGLATADKAESQEICFVPGGDYRAALRERAGWEPEPGPLVDADGALVGTHQGAAAYTVGQRKGIGVALGEPRYVSRIDPRSNTITLARRADLETRAFEVEEASFIAGAAPGDGGAFEAVVRIRHRARLVPAVVRPAAGPAAAAPAGVDEGSGASRGPHGRWVVETGEPVWAAAPGQAAVFYDGELVLGGGRIARPAA